MSDYVASPIQIARRFGPIFPMSAGNRPLTPHGSRDATADEIVIQLWWKNHPEASPALLTGKPSGIVALDLDMKNGVDGRHSLEMLGISFHPQSPTDHSPHGGYHVLFRRPDRAVRSGTIAPGLEVKGDRAWITLPPGRGRYWDPVLGLDTPLAPMPP